MKINRQRRVAGVTMTELLVVVVVVALLATLAVPVYTHQAAKARLAATQYEMKQIAQSMERVAMDTGYFIRLYALNDGFTGDAVPNADPNDRLGGVADNSRTDAIDSRQIYHRSNEIFLTTELGLEPPNGVALFEQLVRDETAFGWDGPYMNWHRDVNGNDWPDDPWGNDYMFFSFFGATFPPADRDDPFDNFDQNGPIMVDEGPEYQVSQTGSTGGGTVVTREFQTSGIFDRPVILSLGPNGLPGDGTNNPNDGYGRGDDIIYEFGGWRGIDVDN